MDNEKIAEDMQDIAVPSSVLEELFGVTDRTIRYLAEQGMVSRNSHGRYQLMKSVKGYILALRASKAGTKIRLDDEEADLDLDLERAKHEHVKKQISEIKLQLIKGQVHKAEDVQAVMTDMLAKFRSKMTALPAKLAKKLEGKNRKEIQAILKKEIDNALSELSAYNPSDFYSDEHIEIDPDAISAIGGATDET